MMANMANGDRRRSSTPTCCANRLRHGHLSLDHQPDRGGRDGNCLIKLRDEGDGEPADLPMFNFKEFCGLIGFQQVWDFEKKWAL